MKYFIDTHDKSKGSFPTQELTEEQFFEQFAALEEAATQFGVFGHAAHVHPARRRKRVRAGKSNGMP